jgi:hypothetical protein
MPLITLTQGSGLLRTPVQHCDEGPFGYQLRLAEDNLLSFQKVSEIHPIDLKATSLPNSQGDIAGQLPPYISKHSRFCPTCLKARGTWHVGWEVLFADACPVCCCWLVDSCSVCHASLHWQRAKLLFCDCGQSLIDEIPSPAPSNVCLLSKHLHRLAMGYLPNTGLFLDRLSLNQCARIILFLGAYASFPNSKRPQKIADLDQLRVSWHVTSSAAEVIFNWPVGFNSIASSLKASAAEGTSGRLPVAFRGFYLSLYRSFRSEEFEFLREAFQNYMAEFWTEGVTRRNGRLRNALLGKVDWIPANHACSQMGISRRRLLALIDDCSIRGSQRTTEKGRVIVLVHRADVQSFCKTQIEHSSLLCAANRLGFKKSRLQSLLPVICPDAFKLGDLGCPWSIPTSWIDAWAQFIDGQPTHFYEVEDCISVENILRYKAWKNDQAGTFLVHIFSGKLPLIGRLKGVSTIGGLLVSNLEVNAWFNLNFVSKIQDYTIPQVAALLRIKQEVAYSLVRTKLLHVNVNAFGARIQQYVRKTELDYFNSQYVFCRDLALQWKTSPRTVRQVLNQAGVVPVAGPEIDGCRQLLYRRIECRNYFERVFR